MNFDFPLILMLLTLITGVIAGLDRFYLAPKRDRKVESLTAAGATDASLEAAAKESFVVEQSKSFFPVLLVVFVLRSFIAEPFQIPSGSMEPGLVKGDFILVSKFSYGIRMPVFDFTLIPTGEPERGDVMVFFPPNDPRYFIKRVIGLPGDHIVFRNRQLTINGKAIETTLTGGEPAYSPIKYLAEEQLGDHLPTIQWMVGESSLTGKTVIWAGPEGEWTVPEGQYFMMGDNRGNSADSRAWGFVPEKNIVGQAKAIWMHWESWGQLPSFSRTGWIK
ncbi:MAG: signal peptidase I [Venatoribacter sp.]